MTQSALGAALTIPQSALDAIDRADKRLNDIQKTAANTANAVTTAFNGMTAGTQPFATALDQIIAKLNAITTAAASAGAGLGGLNNGLGAAGNNASATLQNIEALVNQLASVGGMGAGNVMQAVMAFKRLKEAINNTSGSNIAELKKQIRDINSALNDPNAQLNKQAQDSLVKRKKLLQDELKYQQQMDDERLVSFQKALDRMASAGQTYANKQRKAYGDQAKNYQQSNYQHNTTYQGALDFSASANTLNQQAKAIEYLKEARMKLSTTDADYSQKLAAINAAIDKHSQKLKEAGAQTKNLQEQTSYMAGYISRWAQRMALAFSIDTLKNFASQVVNVRGQFEISQRSLEAILQDKPKADEIFNKTVELAVKSPFQIKDLVDYTRQLSAYRIESDKLYDTTKRLADVSAGLGVDMGRLILAYGQVKAAAYLRGSEVRQFTEAGINMYGELQDYFKEVKGEAYTTAQIVDMISKRKVTFEDVEAIFERMTSKGGTFYNMQEIQAETLQGKVANLKDAFDVMLNDIGKSNENVMKGTINFGTTLLNNWEAIAGAGKALVSVLALIMLQANKTGVSLQVMWANTGFTTYAIKGKGVLGILASSFKTLGSAAKSAGIMMKEAFMGNLPLVAIATIISLITSAVSAYAAYKEAQQDIIDETVAEKAKIGELVVAYQQLKDAKTSVNAKGNLTVKAQDQASFITSAKETLQQLYDELTKRGLTVPIEIGKVDMTNVDKAMNEAKNKLYDFIQMAADAKSYINGQDNSFWNSDNLSIFGIPLWADSFSKDMKELQEAENSVLEYSSRAQAAMDTLGEGYDKLTEKSRRAYDSIKGGNKNGELDVEYLQRVAKVMQQISTQENGRMESLDIIKNMRTQMSGLSNYFHGYVIADFRNARNEAAHELQGLFDDVNSIYSARLAKMAPAEVKVFFDNVATQNNLTELQRKILLQIAAKTYRFKVEPDENSANNAKKKIYTFLDDLQAEADRRKIKISFGVVDPKDALQQVKNMQSSANEIKQLIDQISRSSITGYHASALGIKAGTQWRGQKIGQGTYFKKSDALAFLKDQLNNTLKAISLAGGEDPFAKENAKTEKKNAKEQRDLLQERITLLKDMNSKYNELIKTETKENALAKTRKYFNEAAQNAGLNADDIMPDNKTTARRIREIGEQYKEIAKRGSAFRMSADLDLKVSEKEYSQLKDDISQNIEEAFNGLELYKKLKSTGLSDNSVSTMFGDLTSSFDDMRGKIDDEFNKYISKAYQTRYGNDFNRWSESVIKQYNNDIANTSDTIKAMFDPQSEIAKNYLSQTQKLDKQVYQEQVSMAQELIKSYKSQLTDQLQLDKWYIEERQKLQSNAEIAKNPDLQKELQGNLNAQYRQKTDANTWKSFQNSDMYVRLFDNLDQVSTKALDAMAEKLQDMRENLKNLDPTQLKAIVEQINKVDEVRNSRNPFKAFTSGLKEMVKASKDLKKLGGVDKYVQLNNQRGDVSGQLEARNKEVELIQQEYDNIVKVDGAESEAAKQTELRLSIAKAMRDNLKDQLELTDQQIAKLGTVMTEEEKAKAKFSNSVTSVTTMVTSMGQAFNTLLQGLGSTDTTLSNSINLLDHIGQAVGSYYQGNYGAIVSNAVGAIGDIVNIFGNENDITSLIEQQERQVSKLEVAYDKLKEAMDNAFDTTNLYEYNKKAIETLEKEQKAYKNMIEAEYSKKNTDESKILSYQQKIDELNDTIKELGENMTETLGGFGSEANYKSAAEAFAEAWVDAFNEGSDALDALNDKFDEYIENLITKQATQRVVGKLIEPLLKEIDNAISEGSEGGNNGLDLTKNELAKIKELGGETMQEVNDALSSLLSTLGYKGKNSSTLSNLQQGIQSVTESTAQALESILNSMRYYLATQQADVRIIRDTLMQKLGVSATNASQENSSQPMLVELKLQTTVLTEIRDTLSNCVKSGHKQGRSGIKVFID